MRISVLIALLLIATSAVAEKKGPARVECPKGFRPEERRCIPIKDPHKPTMLVGAANSQKSKPR